MNEGSEATNVAFLDLILALLLGFVAIALFFLPHLNPPGLGDETTPPPGNIIVEARWADGIDVDIDLWILDPSRRAVSYANKNGDFFDLLRDDLGNLRDDTRLNYEFAFSRGTPDGEYIINVHHFRGSGGIDVDIKVMLSSGRQVFAGAVRLVYVNQEITVVRFRLKNGVVVAGSIHNTPRPIRTGSRQ